jgi:hypothetical protein
MYFGNLTEEELFEDKDIVKVFKEFCKKNRYYREPICDKVVNSEGAYHIYRGRQFVCHDKEQAKNIFEFLKPYSNKIDMIKIEW